MAFKRCRHQPTLHITMATPPSAQLSVKTRDRYDTKTITLFYLLKRRNIGVNRLACFYKTCYTITFKVIQKLIPYVLYIKIKIGYLSKNNE